MTAHEPNPDQRRTSLRQSEIDAIGQGQRPVKPAKPPTAPSPLGKLDVEALESQRAHERDLAGRGARPVEDREPVGPYAPTRDGRTLNARYEADPGLFEAGYRQGWRERDTPGSTPRYADLTVRAQSGELATDEEMNAPISDQAQKNVREALMSAEEHRHRGYEAGFSGGKIVGAVEREAELLDQGWTPPGATSVDARLLDVVNSGYPTEYEVWRDAVSIAGAQRDRRPPAKDLADRLTADAEWFWELLQEVPVLKFDDSAADQAIDDQIARIDSSQPPTMRTVVDGQDDTWHEVEPDKWLMHPQGDVGNARDLKYIEHMYGLKSV